MLQPLRRPKKTFVFFSTLMSTAKMGFTILELMIAMFIFSVTAASLIYGLRTGDRIRGKAHISRCAAQIAENDAERIRAAAIRGIRPNDTTYTDTVSRAVFLITRKAVIPEGANTPQNTSAEVEISVEPQGGFYQPYIFKVIQGVYQ